jgi:hypothetical protein
MFRHQENRACERQCPGRSGYWRCRGFSLLSRPSLAGAE